MLNAILRPLVGNVYRSTPIRVTAIAARLLAAMTAEWIEKTTNGSVIEPHPFWVGHVGLGVFDHSFSVGDSCAKKRISASFAEAERTILGLNIFIYGGRLVSELTNGHKYATLLATKFLIFAGRMEIRGTVRVGADWIWYLKRGGESENGSLYNLVLWNT